MLFKFVALLACIYAVSARPQDAQPGAQPQIFAQPIRFDGSAPNQPLQLNDPASFGAQGGNEPVGKQVLSIVGSLAEEHF